ncbi:unnamed protein product [marine sediment metagenome]|uniref:Uncharacterized protein n=1 Tax=marine sediment metagenome TaxID=412755 RepID=X0XNP5_9ZZZZ
MKTWKRTRTTVPCAGTTWCAVRISKEIAQLASGKHPNFQPDAATKSGPALTPEQCEYLARRQRMNACHSELVEDCQEAERARRQELVR